MQASFSKYPALGYGLGLRVDHYEEILNENPNIDWLEVMSENYMIPGGRPLHYLEQMRQRYPLVMHGVSLSIGSADPLNREYLTRLKRLAETVSPAWISDHLCWTGVEKTNLHDLMPLPYTEEAITHICDRVSEVQDFLGQRILLENVSSYVTFHQSSLKEWEFLAEIAERADCLILLDINNIYVSSHNHHFDPIEYLNGIPTHRVQQFHLAGHVRQGDLIIDTHDAPIVDPVWDLYGKAIERFGFVSTMIERDDHIPSLAELVAELDIARGIAEPILRAAA
jgi:uncharacterized protein